MHVSHKKSSGWEPSFFQPLGLLPSHHKGGEGDRKKERKQFYCYYKLWSSFLALSLLPPSATSSQSLYFPCRSQGRVGKNREALILECYLTSSRLPPFTHHDQASVPALSYTNPCKVSIFTEKLSVTKKLFPCVLLQCGWGITHIFSTPQFGELWSRRERRDFPTGLIL